MALYKVQHLREISPPNSIPLWGPLFLKSIPPEPPLFTLGTPLSRAPGKWDKSDGTIEATAFREAQEEIHLLPDRLTYLTTLHPQLSKHQSLVFPVVCWVDTVTPVSTQTMIASLVPNPTEVEAIFSVPLNLFLLHGSHHTSVVAKWLNQKGRFHHFQVHQQNQVFVVWGLTASFCIDLVCREGSGSLFFFLVSINRIGRSMPWKIDSDVLMSSADFPLPWRGVVIHPSLYW
jgi:hypothetical protein